MLLTPGIRMDAGRRWCVPSLVSSQLVSRMKLDLPVRFGVIAALVPVLLAACADAPSVPPPGFTEARQGLGRIYRLGVGDKLKITVFGEDNLSGPAEVSALGSVSMPLVGEIEARGLSIAEFRERVTRRLSDGYLKNPKVNVEITNYRPIYIHGEVKSGGEFPFKAGLKLRDAIALAGGYTYRADENYLLVVREGEQPVRLGMPSSVDVLPGDNIRVPERFF